MKKKPAEKKKNKGGAPKGNKNAFRHGIFTKFISLIDDREMAQMAVDNSMDELALARVKLANALERQERAADDETYLKYDQAVRHWTEIVSGIIARTNTKEETEVMVFETLLDSIRYWNDRQSVK